ncbi:MAG: hypothetical protein ACYC5H_13295 [Methylovirgula sp.]
MTLRLTCRTRPKADPMLTPPRVPAVSLLPALRRRFETGVNRRQHDLEPSNVIRDRRRNPRNRNASTSINGEKAAEKFMPEDDTRPHDPIPLTHNIR